MILIDLNQVLISNLMQQIGSNPKIKLEEDLIRHMVMNSLRSYAKQFKHKYGTIVVACDSRKYWRREVFPFYKAHRKNDREKSPLDWHFIFEVLNKIRDELKENFPYKVLEVEGAEADDVIAILSEWSQTNDYKSAEGIFGEPEPQPVLILSGDHDFIQLQKFKNVSQYSPIHKKWIKPEQSINNYLMEHIIKGDKGDGIPNILSADDTFTTETRQKPVTSKKLEAWQTINIDEFHTQVDEETARNFQRNRYLIDFSYIPDTVRNNILEAWIHGPKKDRSQLLNYFIEHRMKNLIDHLGDF
jgi:hypothetical protein